MPTDSTCLPCRAGQPSWRKRLSKFALEVGQLMHSLPLDHFVRPGAIKAPAALGLGGAVSEIAQRITQEADGLLQSEVMDLNTEKFYEADPNFRAIVMEVPSPSCWGKVEHPSAFDESAVWALRWLDLVHATMKAPEGTSLIASLEGLRHTAPNSVGWAEKGSGISVFVPSFRGLIDLALVLAQTEHRPAFLRDAFVKGFTNNALGSKA